jgi:hypothetical protein
LRGLVIIVVVGWLVDWWFHRIVVVAVHYTAVVAVVHCYLRVKLLSAVLILD